jgi:hypothetical protein
MRRRAIGLGLTVAAALVARVLAPRLHARLAAGCERMFEQMPDTFPPKRMLRGIEEIHANSARTVELLEAREKARPDGREKQELAGVVASTPTRREEP